MVRKDVKNQILEGVKIGEEEITVSMLKYVAVCR